MWVVPPAKPVSGSKTASIIRAVFRYYTRGQKQSSSPSRSVRKSARSAMAKWLGTRHRPKKNLLKSDSYKVMSCASIAVRVIWFNCSSSGRRAYRITFGRIAARIRYRAHFIITNCKIFKLRWWSWIGLGTRASTYPRFSSCGSSIWARSLAWACPKILIRKSLRE